MMAHITINLKRKRPIQTISVIVNFDDFELRFSLDAFWPLLLFFLVFDFFQLISLKRELSRVELLSKTVIDGDKARFWLTFLQIFLDIFGGIKRFVLGWINKITLCLFNIKDDDFGNVWIVLINHNLITDDIFELMPTILICHNLIRYIGYVDVLMVLVCITVWLIYSYRNLFLNLIAFIYQTLQVAKLDYFSFIFQVLIEVSLA